MNGVPWGELLPLNAPVSIGGFYTFTRATVSAALRSDNINGVDLSREAVLLDVEQNIQGEGTEGVTKKEHTRGGDVVISKTEIFVSLVVKSEVEFVLRNESRGKGNTVVGRIRKLLMAG